MEWNDTQQSTDYQSGKVTKLEWVTRVKGLTAIILDCEGLSGRFRRLRNQSFIGKPNIYVRQSKYDSTLNLRERKSKHSTIIPQKEKEKDSLIASAKNKRIAKIVIPKLSATA